MNATADLPRLQLTPPVQYVLRLGDTCLIHAQRLAEWCGHGPILEEDIALTNMALDLVGQARALLTLAGQMAAGPGDQACTEASAAWDEDQMAFLRSEGQYFNLTLVEQPMRRSSAHAPGGDFADTVLRNFLVASWLKQFWQALAAKSDAAGHPVAQSPAAQTLAAIAGKAVKEVRYQQQHNADWVVRLGDGNAESTRRMAAALLRAWPYVTEMFQHDAVDEAAEQQGLGPARRNLRAGWLAEVGPVLAAAGLPLPPDSPYASTGSRGRHSEHMGFILADMQSLQRQFPGGRW